MFVREKPATTQVRDNFLSPLLPRPDLGLPVSVLRAVPSLHSKGNEELISLVDPNSDSGSDSDPSDTAVATILCVLGANTFRASAASSLFTISKMVRDPASDALWTTSRTSAERFSSCAKHIQLWLPGYSDVSAGG